MQDHSSLFTYDDYLTLPNDGKRYEIINGDLYMSPAPLPEHQLISIRLEEIFLSYVRKEKWGKIFHAPIDVVFSMTEIVQPDIVLVSKQREEIIAKKNLISAPDLIVEILSETTEKTDRTKKKEMYEKYGVREYWIVDPSDQSIEIFVLEQSRYATAQKFVNDDIVDSTILPGIAFPARSAFEYQ
jgi:Uma2 family endonuclease